MTPLRRILIVDDEENIALTLQLGLARLPECEVVMTSSSREALRLFAVQPFDLLITDYMMPDLDGLSLIAHIRHQHPHTPVMMITAYRNETLQQQAHLIPIQCLLDKPVALKTVRAKVIDLLDRQQKTTSFNPLPVALSV